jgi:ribosome-binding factor A
VRKGKLARTPRLAFVVDAALTKPWRLKRLLRQGTIA